MSAQRIDLADLALDVVSVAGIESALDVPAFKVAVDFGRGDDNFARRRHVCLTHAHIDHLGGLAHHVGLRALWRLPAPVYLVPAAIRERVERLLDAWRALQEDALPATVRGVEAGEEVALRPGLVARAFATDHRVPSLGYLFVRRTHRLRRDLEGLPGVVIAAKRRAGEVVEDALEVAELAVAGDTRIDALLAAPEVLRARRLVMEVTFLDDRVDVATARSKGHTHLDELAAHADAFENEALLLCHVSTRYSVADARALVKARLPGRLAERCTVLASDLTH